MAAEPTTLLCSTVRRQKPAQRHVFVTRGPEIQQTFLHSFLLLSEHILQGHQLCVYSLTTVRFLQMRFNIVKNHKGRKEQEIILIWQDRCDLAVRETSLVTLGCEQKASPGKDVDKFTCNYMSPKTEIFILLS